MAVPDYRQMMIEVGRQNFHNTPDNPDLDQTAGDFVQIELDSIACGYVVA